MIILVKLKQFRNFQLWILFLSSWQMEIIFNDTIYYKNISITHKIPKDEKLLERFQ